MSLKNAGKYTFIYIIHTKRDRMRRRKSAAAGRLISQKGQRRESDLIIAHRILSACCKLYT